MNYQPAIRVRTLANVLLDLREAKRDWEQALADAEIADDPAEETEAGDRMSAADTRVDDLRDEFAERFLEATGLTFKQIEDAIGEAVL